MFANHVLLKLFLAPLIILAATLVARRYGEQIGGLMVGLPLTSGPVSIFFALEQGKTFAAHAAQGAMLGLIPVAVFCTGYAWGARRRAPWLASALFGLLPYLVIVWGMSYVFPGLGLIVLLVISVLALGLWLVGRPKTIVGQMPTPWWDLPLRMLVATSMLLAITTAASSLGPQWSGLLSPFPIFTFVMAVFAHRQTSPTAAWQVIRGVLSGLFGYLAFFVVVALCIAKLPLPWTYLLAAAAALGLNGTLLVLIINRSSGSSVPTIAGQ